MTATQDTPSTAPDTSASPRLPLVSSLVVGLLCAVALNFVLPEMLRLSFLCYLPFYLGLFFFLLYGLLIGAVMFRVGRSARPAPRGAILLFGIMVVLTIWVGGLYQEYLAFPQSAVEMIRGQITGRMAPEHEADLQIAVQERLTAYWTEHYPVGGFAGFVMWMASGESIEYAYKNREEPYIIPAKQQGAGFLFRVLVSLGLLFFSILSQYLDLAKPPPAGEPSYPAGSSGSAEPEGTGKPLSRGTAASDPPSKSLPE